MHSLINYLGKGFFEEMSKTRIVCFSLYIVLCLALVILIIFIIVHASTITNYKKIVGYGKNNVRIFTIHYNENKVYVIDKHNLKIKQTHDIDWIYEGVSQPDKLRLKVWLLELKKVDHKVPHHIELHVYIKKIKTTVFSILEVNSIDYERSIIHLESHLFPNINKIKKDKNSKIFIKNEEVMPQILEQHNREFITVFNLRLFSTYEFDSNTKFRADHLVITQIVNRLVKYLSSSRYLTLLKSNEIVITDFSIPNTNGAVALGHTFAKEMSKILFLNALQNQFSFKIGIVHDKTRTKAFNELVKTAKEMSIFAEDNEIQSPVILYDSALNYQQLSQNTIIDNIKQVIDRDELVRKYTAIYNGKNQNEVFGYNIDYIPKKSLLSSMTDIQEYAYNNNLSSSLIHVMYQSAHIAIKNGLNQKVMINLQLPYYKDIIDLLNDPNCSKDIMNTIFIFEDKDISSFLEDNKTTIEVLNKLNEKQISIGLTFTSSVLELSNEILSKFNYYVIDEKNFANVLSSSKHQILFQDLIGKLKTFNGQLISINVASWQSLEYLIKNGIYLFSSDLLGYEFNQLPLLDEKKYDKALALFK